MAPATAAKLKPTLPKTANGNAALNRVRHAAAHQGLGGERPGRTLAGRLRHPWRRGRGDGVVHHRLRDRAGWTARLAHRRTEETQYIIAGTGRLYLEDGTTHEVRTGSVFVLPTPLRHALENTGTETLKAVAFFAGAMFTQDFDQVMMPPKSHILGTPNRAG